MPERLLKVVVWILAGAAVAALATFDVSSYDEWWHLAAGNHILEHRTVPTRDVFSSTTAGRPWVTHEWLFEVLLALAHRLGRLPAVLILRTVLVMATFLLSALALRRLRVHTVVAVPLLAAAGYLVTFRAFARPHVATETLAALYMFALVVAATQTSREAGQRLWFLIPVQVLWANLHAGAMFGPLLVLLFAAGAAADWLLPESDRQAHRARRVLNLLALGLCLLAASLLNPNTYRVLLYPLFLTSSATFTGSIMELQSPLLPLFRGSDFVVALALLLLVGLASFILNRARRPSHLLLFAAFGAAGLLSLRNLPLFAITAVPLVGFNLRDVVPGRAGPRARAALLTGILLASAALLARTLLVGTRLPGGFRRPGLGIARATFPADAAEFVSRNRVKGNVLNTMEFGGYLIWRWHPARRVFTDGRLDVYGPTFFERYSRALWSTATFDSLAAEHNISCAVLAWPPRFDGSTVRYVGRTLALRPGWSLVHWDDVALVYVRANSVDSALARREGYASVAPFLLWPGPADTPAVENLVAETRRAVASVPGSTRTHTALGWALLRSRDVSAASNEFSLALAINPRSVPALQGLAMCAAAGSDSKKTAEVLTRLVRLTPRDAFAHHNLGYALLQQQNFRPAARHFDAALKLNPKMVAAHNGLADALLGLGRTDQALRQTQEALRLDPGNPSALSRLKRLTRSGR